MPNWIIKIKKIFCSQQNENKDEIHIPEENQIGHNESSIHQPESIKSSSGFSEENPFAIDESYEVIINNNPNHGLTKENLQKHYNLQSPSPNKDNIGNWLAEVEKQKNSWENNEQNFAPGN